MRNIIGDMKDTKDAKELIGFLESSPSTFHVVSNMAAALEKAGFRELREEGRFSLRPGDSCYVVRGGSSIIALCVPVTRFSSMHIVSAHTDSPCFKVKPEPVDTGSGSYSTLNVETYGGLTLNSWFDRPLSIAGRAFTRTDEGISCRLVDFGRDLLCIPSLAIHQNRNVNDGVKISVQKEMRPLFSTDLDKGLFLDLLSRELEVGSRDILDWDLYLYNRTSPCIWGADDEFISAARLDDLMCAHAAFRALVETRPADSLSMIALFDNEEVGSSSRQGALSDFLANTCDRILGALGYDGEEKCMIAASSMVVSADNAHALHPNYPEKCDPTNRPVMNKGVVIKYAANQKYTTDGYTAAYLKDLMDRNGIPYQVFVNNSDVTGGSTLGNLSIRRLSIPSIDVGLAQLAMHSSYETAGVEDCRYAKDLFRAFLSL